MALSPAYRNIVVIGASAGGHEALSNLLTGVPTDLPAALLVVLHMSAPSHLTTILKRRSALPVARAVNGEEIEPARVYVAVPDRHLLVHDNHVLLRKGPRENQARPAIDPLFRTAAATFGSRVIGIVLSGSLSDGTAGLRAIKRCGGLAIVQAPTDAVVADMPASAIRHADVDHVCRAGDMGALLGRLVRQQAGAPPETPLDIRLEAAIAVQEAGHMNKMDQLGAPSRFTCPECHGALWEIQDGPVLRYRCHVGHAFAADSVLAGQDQEIQGLLENLLRSHSERAALVRRMAENERREQRHSLADQLERRAGEYDEGVRVMRELMLAAMASAPS